MIAFAKRYFGQDSLSWFHKSYILDWVFVSLLWLISYFISYWPVYEREFSLTDKTIALSHKENQVGSGFNFTAALFVPLLLVVVVGFKNRSIVDLHHGTLALLAGRGLARMITEYFKHRVGRLRPDFLARCKWDEVAELCAGKKSSILDGRMSFPSGHSSTAFAGMIFLTLWIAGQTAAICLSAGPSVRWMPSRLAALALTLAPISWATHVAFTRIEDHRHHMEDVIVGSLIGTFSAAICYLLFWPSPFHISSFNSSGRTEARYLYISTAQSRGTYELTTTNDDVV
ncbi:hypothetical protein AGABI2DRAFT_205847 [Agaricus bisporus var. bisporus H97]|uniref:hypothetical protein n=1 Tax=Agaricus bisporus var. bisporus (strain H97 / ATCC MYA-4626 / FGSC 10389) TaxID=936046 RepID=UPI00029F6FB5|nr:hypothetical protein AGABI2DRAFT_205847 [Agaricus bisporus var. bisporus H97]EKV46539.1 hypothetical protein AGABI2DRAFT_205847 [Agaricus bisporus var. bisporus H97]